ncbi:hypothetical protein NBRC116188_11380 [Oceaniserpentilla sp. 4NH20-0058]|uniref:hypothetical protein n=1 Tax=Oceaniserpentilla sp. 4NH20-0058 TaxID=3127660 RepID=UPI00310775B5
MKLPNNSSLSSATQHAQGGLNTTATSEASASALHPKLPERIQALVNTWAKVQSHQLLPPQQNQQVLSQLSALIAQPSPINNQGTGISEKLNLEHITASLNKSESFTQTTQLALVKLLSTQGQISILSTQKVKPGDNVLISQTPSGQLSLTLKASQTSLSKYLHQFLPGHITSKPIPLIDNHQAGPSSPSLNPIISKPINPILNSQNIPTAPSIKVAIESSGQNLEQKLQTLLSTLGNGQVASTPATQSPKQALLDSTVSVQNRFNQVEQQIQKWVHNFQQKFTIDSPSPTVAPNTLTTTSNLISGNVNQTSTQTLQEQVQKGLNQLLAHAPSNDAKPTIENLFHNIQSDQKNWLSSNQQTLIQQLTQSFKAHGDQFIPNWSNQLSQSANIKTFNDLTHWFNLLINPKSTTTSSETLLIKTGVSVQAQLNQTLALLANSLEKSENNTEQILIRQLLNLSQNIMKTSHDQILNRNWMNTPELQSFQLSLPYLHQHQINWCELEFKGHTQTEQEQQKSKSWHIILRFAQDTDQAFAIESKMIQEKLDITLWASHINQLKCLHQEIPTLKEKLTKAGFKLESIQSKHGSPTPLNTPIQQSLIDVHT